MLDAQRWIAHSRESKQGQRLWYLGKIPYSDDVFGTVGREVVAATATIQGAARRLIVLDLDDTLWGGVVGDDGWESLRLGGHDSVGEAFVDFQRELRALSRRGILLALVSKNDEAVALEAIDRHSAMVLGRDDMVGWRINWSDKAANIVDLVASLNLGLQSVVFIDDSPYERARVRETLPEVLVPEWPTDPTDYVSTLTALTCFDTLTVSEEDRARTSMYAAERRRTLIKRMVAVPTALMFLSVLAISGGLAYLSLEDPPLYKKIVQKAESTLNELM